MIGVIGDLMLDEFWFGSVNRYTPESANTPIVKVNNNKKLLGGAANVALNVKKLEEPVMLFGVIGTDQAGLDIQALIKENNMSYSIIKSPKVTTTRKIRVYNGNEYAYRIDIEEKQKHTQNDILGLLEAHDLEYLILSDYNKGSIENAQEIINSAQVPVFVDPKNSLDRYKGTFVLKPNFTEFIEWSNLKTCFYIEDFIHNNYFELIKIRNILNVTNLIITAGADGCILVTEKVRLFKAPTTKEVDVTGAGDSFLAALICRYKQTKNITKAVQYANLVASIAVSKKGTAYVNKSETTY